MTVTIDAVESSVVWASMRGWNRVSGRIASIHPRRSASANISKQSIQGAANRCHDVEVAETVKSVTVMNGTQRPHGASIS